MTLITTNNVQRAATPKAGNSELLFLCFAHCIILIYICIKFQENISDSFHVTQIYYRNHIFKAQRAVTPKVG